METQRAEHGPKYRVLLDLGEGGMATVYLAMVSGPSGFSKLVVLKTLKRGLAEDAEAREMFLNEARLSARLNHPNVVDVQEVLDVGGTPVIVMQYLRGRALSEIVARVGAKLPMAMHLRIITEALAGLDYSHQLCDYDGTPLNIVHRDFTPHNVFVTFEGHVKVLDFGIAKASTAREQTKVGIIKGKVAYMPPEQLTGDPVDRRADIYAAGVVMWEAIVGARMWGETGEALMMSKILEGEIPPPRSIKPELPDELERICMKALAYDPAERYQTAADMQLDIEEYLSRAGTLVAQRDIGAFVNESFRDIFEQTQRVIEKSQAEPMTVAGSEIIYFPPSLASAAVTLTASRTQTQLRTNRLPVFAVAGLGLLVLALVIALVLARRGESSRMADAAAAAASARASEEPKTVQFRVTAFPAGAQLFLDGVPLPSNPFSEARPKDADPHVVRAELAGHKPRAVSVSFQRDSDIVLYLEREVPEARADAGAELPKSRGGVGRTKQRDPAKAEPTAPSRRDYGF